MKTYKRKAQQQNEIVDVHELCRLCLNKADKSFPIFKNDQDVCAAIALRIMICVGLEVSHEECLPNLICSNCFDELERYYKFRRKCEVTYQRLKSHVLAVKCKELNDIEHKNMQKELNEFTDTEVEHKDLQMEYKDIQMDVNQIEMEPKYIEIETKDIHMEKDFQMETIVMQTELKDTDNEVKHKPHKIERKDVLMDTYNMDVDNKNYLVENKEIQVKSKDLHIEYKYVEIEQQARDKNASKSSDQTNQDGNANPSSNPGKLSDQVENSMNQVVESEEIQHSVQKDSTPSISTFLTAILTQLAILGSEEGKLVFQRESIKSIELETGDDEHLVLELIEEDEDAENQEEIDVSRSHEDIANLNDSEQPTAITLKPKESNIMKAVSGPWCAVCGRTFSTRSAATRHARAHRHQHEHACPVCRRTFTQKAVMERHQLVHLAVRPHRCTMCSASYTQRGALEAHARTHAHASAPRQLTLHRCSHCDKIFLHASGLSRHVMTHQGRVYQCSVCDKQFNDRSSLLRHQRNFHHQNFTKT